MSIQSSPVRSSATEVGRRARVVTRRRFVLAGFSSVLALPWFRCSACAGRGWSVAPILAGFALDGRGAAIIGRYYLQCHPEEADAQSLWTEVFGAEKPDGTSTETHHFEALRRAFSDRRAGDFAAGECLVVEGWLFARTEARLCALVAVV